MSTTDNLAEAFAGESQANRKYTAFAQKAEKDGYPGVARLFRAAAHSETVHALNHFRIMGQIGETGENLRAAIKGETGEFEQMYPDFIKEAESEGNRAAVISFTGANAVEKIHASLYEKAYVDPAGGTADKYYVCEACGNTVENEPPDVCPICQAPRDKFTLIE